MIKSTSLRKFASVCLTLGSIVGLSATAHANQFQLTLNVPAGGTSIPIAVPGINTPVSVTCVQNTAGNRGVGQATVLRVSPASFLEWVGMDVANAGVPSTGFTSTAGTHIIFCDFSKEVDLQVASATQMQVKNTNAVAQSVVINFVY
jgi:hypothetical protein